MSLENRIRSLEYIFRIISNDIKSEGNNELYKTINQTEIHNPWFTKENIISAVEYWANILNEVNLNNWLSYYSFSSYNKRTIGLILSGNIPLEDLHDCISTLLLNHKAKIKLSLKDKYLIPYILNLWKEYCPELSFEFIEKLENYDAIITTENNSKSNYLNQYFKNVPNIIRKKRASIAVITGNETDEELELLAKDTFGYFGLSCRNVSNIQIPKGYDLNKLFKSYLSFHSMIHHNKYCNNYDYNKAIFLLNGDLFWDNNFILLKADNNLFSSSSVIHYNEYENLDEVIKFIEDNKENIQNIVSNNFKYKNVMNFGKSLIPELKQYIDKADSINFLLSL